MKMIENMEKVKQIGLNISFYRRRLGLTQAALASQVFVSREQISKVESPNNKTTVSMELLLAIADALEIDVRDLFEFKE